MNAETLLETDFHCPLCGEPLPRDATECTKCDWVPGYRPEKLHRVHEPRDVVAADAYFRFDLHPAFTMPRHT